jgi:hypothetical protein
MLGRGWRAARAAFFAAAMQAVPTIPVDAPIPAAGSPLAPRGGVLAIPLELPPAGRSLPSRVPMRIGDGPAAIAAEGLVGWIVELGPATVRRWTEAANPLRMVAVPDGIDPRTTLDPAADPPRERIVGAMLLAEIPPVAGDPAVDVAGRRVSPRWFDPAPPLPAFTGPIGRLADDAPDPSAPSEWFRHAIRSDLSGDPPPGPPGDEAGRRWARHVAELWRGGIARIEPHAPAFARELRERLVAVATEVTPQSVPDRLVEPRRIAAWIASAGESSPLLAILHDAERDDAAVATATGSWLDVNAPLAAWLEGDSGGTVRVAFLNGGGLDRTLICSWLGADEYPVAAHIPALSLRTVTFDRPLAATPRARPTGDGAEPLVLWLRGDGFEKRITVPFAATPARPPTLNFGSFAAPFTLAESKQAAAASVSPRFSASATVRRRDVRWEVLVECRRNPLTPVDDRVVCDWNGRRLEIDATGRVRSSGTDGISPEVSVAAGPELWRVRIAFPDAWIPEASPSGVRVPLALERIAGDARRSAIVPRPTFRLDPAIVEIDLAAWEAR